MSLSKVNIEITTTKIFEAPNFLINNYKKSFHKIRNFWLQNENINWWRSSFNLLVNALHSAIELFTYIWWWWWWYSISLVSSYLWNSITDVHLQIFSHSFNKKKPFSIHFNLKFIFYRILNSTTSNCNFILWKIFELEKWKIKNHSILYISNCFILYSFAIIVNVNFTMYFWRR